MVPFALSPNHEAPLIVQLTLTTGHAAVKVTLKDGRIVYVDNGAFGGDDQMFELQEVPSYATLGIPSLGITEALGKYWRAAYPTGSTGWEIFDPYGP